jgi:osmotically-inducible protein OsmY
MVSQRMGTSMMHSDLTVHAAVCTALRRALGPVAGRVGVRVHDGVVTLTGIVLSLDQKHAAEHSAEQVSGVRAVAEELQVDGMPAVLHDDVAIAKAVADSLEVEGVPASRHITVRVEAGWVTLSGQVASASDYSAIERALECVRGVRGVTSEVHVIAPPENAACAGVTAKTA